MVTIVTPPSTIDGIKRLAIRIKRAQQIPHQKALEAASQQAGFQNFVHAKRELTKARVQERHAVYLTAYWLDRDGSPRRAGRETLEVTLSRKLGDIITRHQLGRGRNLKGFKWEAEDHLEKVLDSYSRENALIALYSARDALHFLDATGLIPAHTQAHFNAMRIASRVPGRDHESWWIEPHTKAWLSLDEPYGPRAHKERYEWAHEHGLKLAEPLWDGLYNPGQCHPFLLSPSDEVLSRVKIQVEALQKRPPAQGSLISDKYSSNFVSPSRVASGKTRRPRPHPSYGDRMGATPYGGAPGMPSDWRPATAMSLELHMRVGPMLHKLCCSSAKSTGITARTYGKINAVRSRLEDWVFIEHKAAITREVEERLYYGAAVDGYSSPQQALGAIESVVSALRSGYGECKPRRELLALLEAAAEGVVGATT